MRRDNLTMPRLRRADCSGPGIARRRNGRGFVYLDEGGGRVTDPEVVDRLRDLSIPPAWREVWICPDNMGHLQATGLDAAGRKQYLYHPRWRERRDREKFDRMLEFARALPRLRRRAAADLEENPIARDGVLGCAVSLLDSGSFRIGSESYAEENESFGLATMKKSHVRVSGDRIVFDYPAKGGQRHVQHVVDPSIASVVDRLKRRRGGGDELLAYRSGRRWVDVTSADINDYIKGATGGEYSAKDFRTWNATLLAALSLSMADGATTKTGRQTAIRRAVEEVAGYLGNTPAVCRASYIDPRVFDHYLAGSTIPVTAVTAAVTAAVDADQVRKRPLERPVLELLSGS